MTTYKMLRDTKNVFEVPYMKSTQWIICQDSESRYFVDCFDLKEASNRVLKKLILSERKTINSILKKINKQEKINLSVSRPPIIRIVLASEIKQIEMKPLPIEWIQ